MKVLVIDDDVVSRMVLMHLVDSCGQFEILEAEDGADAWEQLAAGLRPALCFCDLRMPRLSGMELLERVRAHPELAAMPFVLASSAGDQETVQLATRSGATGYIVKPFQADQVRARLAALTGAPAPAGYAAEAPALTLQRLGINGERLLVYLAGFQTQLTGAANELALMLARGEREATQVRLERLQAGCLTLGLGGAAEAIGALLAGDVEREALQTVLDGAVRSVMEQAALARHA